MVHATSEHESEAGPVAAAAPVTAAAPTPTAARILSLQRTAGNAAVSQLLLQRCGPAGCTCGGGCGGGHHAERAEVDYEQAARAASILAGARGALAERSRGAEQTAGST